VWQDRVKVEIRRRESQKRWTIEELGAGDVIELRSVGATLRVDAVYDGAFRLKGDDLDPARG
jgi:hypothetical protein